LPDKEILLTFDMNGDVSIPFAAIRTPTFFVGASAVLHSRSFRGSRSWKKCSANLLFLPVKAEFQP
jgi:hypothetical protein